MSRVRVPFPAPFSSYEADVAQSVERVLGKDEVTSSILVIGSRYSRCYNSVGNRLGHDTVLVFGPFRCLASAESRQARHATRPDSPCMRQLQQAELHDNQEQAHTSQPRGVQEILPVLPQTHVSSRDPLNFCAGRLTHESVRSVAQLVEHWSPKPAVAGSSPARPGFFQSG